MRPSFDSDTLAGVKAILDVLKVNGAVKTLDLSDNYDLQDTGAAMVAAFLKVCACVLASAQERSRRRTRTLLTSC